GRALAAGGRLAVEAQLEYEYRAAARVVLDPDLALVHLDDRARQRQAEPVADRVRAELAVGLEDLRPLGGRDGFAGAGHGESGSDVGFDHAQLDLALGGPAPDRVDHQIAQPTLDEILIASQRPFLTDRWASQRH